ncbi:TraI/MobA(P) family conjugative relaxase (plasmid) [Xanthomonas axonopodis pv. nakataecorchori]|uniref:TraI/MobA(P) family conjugative relaxase n=1 Tax=Xanthomonas axonopodis TaxID=53413 RepID=UPI001D501096|nr:relaxase/mobilization nuclease domain-containing protein [Xanthomonas perforans]MBZ3027354.1 relaxase/mobilization nuclease domain-containing protein [Xanthomonas perforans]MBZ3036018.1 relaxase/mobilization nuclease domain-containing protein [Xanthomonas perforans]MBZ3048172.1 relaxase/mobilization nuclease domain-containing protein [Xanthomonas perforans]
MLAPVPPRRPSGQSSFRKLKSYLSEAINPDTGEVLDRGDVFLSPALLSAETAAKEMWAVAAENPRVKDPVEHYILSWQEGEQPSKEQWHEAVTHTLEALGWKDHQWLAVSHEDTDNFHVHVMANKVHPETYRSHTPDWMHKTLDKCCREIEAKQGWAHSNGLYRWDADARMAVPVPREEREKRREANDNQRAERGEAGAGKAGKMEQFGDAESLQTYAKGAPAKALDAVMKREGATWQDVHSALAKHGLELQKGERGGYTVRARSQDGKDVHAKASDVFRKQFAGKAQRAATEAKLGDWQPPAAYVRDVAKVEQRYDRHREPKREWKRDPDKRQQQREERARERAELKARFTLYKSDFYRVRSDQRRTESQQAKLRFKALATEARAKREEIRQADMSPALRQVARSIAAAEAVQAREQLRAQLAEQRQAANRAMDYRTWLVVQAAQGNKAAESQLRGLAYQEQRNATQQGRQSAPELGAHADSGRPEAERAKRPAADPMATRSTLERDRPAAALRMTWEADTRAGTVDYYMDGQKAFTDRGSKVQFAKKDSGHDEIEAALRLGVQKFGKELDIKGSASFKMQAIEVAVMRGIDVQFSEKAMQARYEHLKAAHTAARVEAAQRGHVVPPRFQQPGEALQEAYQVVRDGDGKAQAAAAKNHPELAKAIALDRAAQAFAAEKLPPEAREGFMRETRAKIEQDLREGKPLSEIRKDLNRDRDAEQDHGL